MQAESVSHRAPVPGGAELQPQPGKCPVMESLGPPQICRVLTAGLNRAL